MMDMDIATIFGLDPNAMGRRRGYYGRWRDQSTPKGGWDCTACLTDQDLICEMCEYKHIANAYAMQHPDHPETLLCGSECAGWMTNPETAKGMRRAMHRKLTARTECRTLVRACLAGLQAIPDRAVVDAELCRLDTLSAAWRAGNGDYAAIRTGLAKLQADIAAYRPGALWDLTRNGNYARRWPGNITATVFRSRYGQWGLLMTVQQRTVSGGNWHATPDELFAQAERIVADG